MADITILKPVFKPDIDFETDKDFLEERATIVHCSLSDISHIRIWPTTFLIQQDGTRKKLLQAYNISEFPAWKFIFGEHTFTLVFEGLDKSCRVFDLLEDITESGAFYVRGIPRNTTDVYHVDLDY
jgi:hypothetical protein